MSITNAIHALFGGGTPQTAQPVPAPQGQLNQNPGATPAASTTTAAPNGIVPANSDGTANTGNPAQPTPMADFAKLWETKPTDDAGNKSIFANIDPQKVREAAGKVDFAQVVTPETLAKIQAGGQDATMALAEALNKVAQTVYAQSAVASTQLIDRALAEQSTRFEAKLPELVKRQTVAESVRGENKIFSDPSLVPVVNLIQNQLVQTYPNASPVELKDMTVKYFKEIASAVNPAPAPSKSSKTAKGDDGFDWEAFANS